MKKLASIILAFLFLLPLAACSHGDTPQSYSKSFNDLFDTASTISAVDSSQEAFNSRFAAVYDTLKAYSQKFDIYADYAGVVNLKSVNDNAGSPVKVDSDIIELLKYGKNAYYSTGGRVNIAMGSVLSLWHDSRENALKNPKTASIPDDKALKNAAKYTNIDDLIIDEKKSTVMLKSKNMSLDVGAIAKGFVCEKIAEYIKNNGIWQSAVVSLGGNVKTIGTKYNDGKTKFNIAVENPSGGDYLCTVGASNGLSVVTSGDYQRTFTVGGKKYCHIINPDTLMPSEYMSAVTVVCNDSAKCDAMSTALFNMSIADGVRLVDSMDGLCAMWVDKNGKITYSNGFEDLIN